MKKLHLLSLVSLLAFTACQTDEPTPPTLSEGNEIPTITNEGLQTSSSEVDALLSSLFPSQTRAGRNYSTITVKDSTATPLYYVVNYADNGGFAIISATKTYTPILAYNNQGNYNPLDINRPYGVSQWESAIKQNVRLSIDHPEYADSLKALWMPYEKQDVPSFNPKRLTRSDNEILDRIDQMVKDSIAAWSSQGARVYSAADYSTDNQSIKAFISNLPDNVYWMCMDNWSNYAYVVERDIVNSVSYPNFVQTKWDQTGEFNQSFPLYDGVNHCAVGCAVVATGQLMRYYRFPVSFNWDNMPLTGGNKTTSDFLYQLAIATNTSLGPSSGTTFAGVEKALGSFGYQCQENEAYNSSKLIDGIKSKKPVLLGGNNGNSASGHMWLASGYHHYCGHFEICLYYVASANVNEGMRLAIHEVQNPITEEGIYCNWGWGGKYDGYYFPANFKPSSYDFSNNIKMLIPNK